LIFFYRCKQLAGHIWVPSPQQYSWFPHPHFWDDASLIRTGQKSSVGWPDSKFVL